MSIIDNPKRDDILKYILTRLKYISMMESGMIRSKKKCGDKWTEKDEIEFGKLHTRKRELESVWQAVRDGVKKPINTIKNRILIEENDIVKLKQRRQND